MEAILILLADLIRALTGIMFGSFFILTTVISLIFDFTLGSILPGPSGGKDVRYQPDSPPPLRGSGSAMKRKPWVKPLLVSAGGLAAVLTVLLLLAETVYFQQTVRWIAHRQTARTGVHIHFDSVEGSFLKRQFSFLHLELERKAAADEAGFNLHIKEMNGAFAGLFLAPPRRMTKLNIHNVQGHIITPDRSGTVTRASGRFSMDLVLQKRPSFTVENLQITRAEIELLSQEETHLTTITVQEWVSAPLRSRSAAFDLLFRSSLEASVGETEITIQTSGEQQARETFWKITPVPIAPLTAFLGPPFNIIQEGEAHLKVYDQWSLADDTLFVDSRWEFSAKNLTLEPDEPGTILSRLRQSAAAGILRRYLEQNNGLDLAFHIRIEDGSLSTTLSGLLQDLLELAKENGLQTAMRISRREEN